jgi:3-hydroxyisobutyrate dehydrogenase
MSDGIGFIGLGNIGKPIAVHLRKLPDPVWVYDVVAAAMHELAAAGARAAESPAELARHCRHIGLCVRDDADVEALLYGGSGLFAHAAAGTLIAVHSTVTHSAILGWARDGAARGITLIDAPISGGASGAEAATLTYMVGGDAAALETCRPVLATSAAKIVHAGALGAGITLKLANNLMSYAAFAAMHEAVALARAAGLSLDVLIEVGKSNGVVTPQMQAFIRNRDEIAASGDAALQKFFGPFGALGKKDLMAALASATQLGVTLPSTRQLAERIEDVFLDRPL